MPDVWKSVHAIFQSLCVDMCIAWEVVGASLESLKEIHKDNSWKELSQACAGDGSYLPKRWRALSKHLGESAVLSTVSHTDSDDPTITYCQSLKRSLLHILDKAIWEMQNKYSMKNVDLMTAISSLVPKSSAFLNLTLFRIRIRKL